VRRALRAAPAVLLAAAGVLALLLARDVQHRQASFRTDDVRFRAAAPPGLWRPAQLFPFGTADALLGVGDDLAYRRALKTLRLARPHELLFENPPALALRAEAQLRLAQIAQTDADPARRSAAENFLGGLAFAGAADDSDSEASLLENAVASFRAAIADDEANDDAKYNLELALTRLKTVRPPPSQKPPKGAKGGAGSGAGTGEPGSGY
jgi:hypothetical protein